MVKTIYNDLLKDLNLKAADVPLFVGETLRQENGGSCYAHNNVVAQMPNTVPTSYVVSSKGCPGNGSDPWHFSAVGYRLMGRRYAYQALEAMGLEAKKDSAYTMPNNLNNFYTIKSIENKDLTINVNEIHDLTLMATFVDGHKEDLASEATFSSSDFLITSFGRMKATSEKKGTVTAVFTDFMGTQHTITININAIDPVSIESPQVDSNEEKEYYDLNGRLIPYPSKGIYILKGEKVVVK